MPRIKHIALTTKEPGKVAAFYKEAFGLQEIRRAPNGAVFLTDGYINLAILNWKTEKSADVGATGLTTAASIISALRSRTSTKPRRSWRARRVSGSRRNPGWIWRWRPVATAISR